MLDGFLGGGASLLQSRDGLGDQESAAVLQTLYEGAFATVDETLAGGLLLAVGNSYVQIAVVPFLHREGLDVVSGGEETTAGLQVELPVMPMADEDAVAD